MRIRMDDRFGRGQGGHQIMRSRRSFVIAFQRDGFRVGMAGARSGKQQHMLGFTDQSGLDRAHASRIECAVVFIRSCQQQLFVVA